MKLNVASGLCMVQRPVAFMLALLPVGALLASYRIAPWTWVMTINAHITNPELADTIEGYATFFHDYAIPVLILSVLLAALNLWCALTLRPRASKA